MSQISRRKFISRSAAGAAAAASIPLLGGFSNFFAHTKSDTTFRAYPHPWQKELSFVYATDMNEDPFKAPIDVKPGGIILPENFYEKRFAINAYWFVEGFGAVTLGADNGGEYFSMDDLNRNANLNLNYEFAKSRVARNSRVKKRYEKSGTVFSPEVEYLTDLSEELYEDATKHLSDSEMAAKLSDRALKYALYAGEKIEIERAKSEIKRLQRTDPFHFGCESRQMIWAKSVEFEKRFPELFNFATVTHYVWDSWYELFEPEEGVYNWGVKDDIVAFLERHNIGIEGRPLFWFHPIVTPDWLAKKNYEELKKYVDKHTREVVGHYGDKISQWEVVNEYHDWANMFYHTPEQTTEITRLALEKTKETNPNVKTLINNCAPWAEYAALGKYARKYTADRPLRSPRKFVQDLLEADVDFDILGIQVYFPQRDLSDIVRMIERFEKFGKPIQITEIGATSGPTNGSVMAGEMMISDAPYDWHRPWDEKLQADWLEAVYSIYYSRPSINAANWYDFTDFRPFIKNGGLATTDVTPKKSYERLKKLLTEWNRLPDGNH